MQDTRMMQRTTFFVLARIFRNQGHKPQTAKSSNLGESVGLRDIFVYC
jgi:hypothetical protein